MKNQTLSIEQMMHLKELCVDTSKASMVLIATEDDGFPLDWEAALKVISEHLYDVSFELFDAESPYYDHSYREDCGVFTLQDILDLLPKKIGEFELRIKMFSFEYEEHNAYKWSIIYESTDMRTYLDTFCQSSFENLLEAAYEMLCWCAGNGYLNK